MTRRVAALVVIAAAVVGAAGLRAQRGAPPAPAGPVIVLDTEKGSIEFETFPADAPKSVEHVLALVRKDFYRGLRFHRVTPLLVQVGDPQSRNMSLIQSWGNGGSGSAIGVAELSKKHLHVRGAVAMATGGGPADADSQFYIMKAANSSLDGKYTVIGQVTKGMDVVDKIEMTDILKMAYVKGEGPKK